MELPKNLESDEKNKLNDRQLFLYNSQKLNMMDNLERQQKVKQENEEKKKLKLNKYFVEDEQKLESKFDLKKIKESRKKNTIKELDFNQIDDDEPERSSDDEFDGKRLHFWIYLKQNFERNIERNLFIEPATGRVWPIDDSPSFPFKTVGD